MRSAHLGLLGQSLELHHDRGEALKGYGCIPHGLRQPAVHIDIYATGTSPQTFQVEHDSVELPVCQCHVVKGGDAQLAFILQVSEKGCTQNTRTTSYTEYKKHIVHRIQETRLFRQKVLLLYMFVIITHNN